MAGTAARVLTHMTCRLYAEREGRALLGGSWRKCLFSVDVISESGIIVIFLTPTTRATLFNPGQYFPQRFYATQVTSVMCKFVAEGKVSISLMNYSAEYKGLTMTCVPPVITNVMISEANPESIASFLRCISVAAKREQPVSEPVATKRRKVDCPLELPPYFVLLQIAGFVNGSVMFFRCLNKDFCSAIDKGAKRLVVKDGKNVPGAQICNLLCKVPNIIELNLTNCWGLRYTDIKGTRETALIPIKTLILKGCKGLNEAGVKLLLSTAEKVKVIDLRGCKQLGVSVLGILAQKTKLKEVSLARFQPEGLSGFFEGKLKLRTIQIEDIHLSDQLLLTLQKLPKLQTLSLQYRTTDAISPLPLWNEVLTSLSVLPFEPYIRQSNALSALWLSVSRCQLSQVSCDVTLTHLSQTISQSAKSLCATELPARVFPLLESLTVFTVEQALMEHFATVESANSCLSTVKKLVIIVRTDWVKRDIELAISRRFPNCKCEIRVWRGTVQKGADVVVNTSLDLRSSSYP